MADDDLVRATVALLEARGRDDVARSVARGGLRRLAHVETWSIGGRERAASSFALVLPPDAFVAFERTSGAREALLEAVRSIVEGPDTALRELFVLVALTAALEPWSLGYRHAPVHVEAAPEADSLVATAVAYLRARGDARAADLLDGAVLERDAVVSADAPRLYRYLLRLTPARLASLERERPLRDAVVAAVDLAARRASERAASVDLALLPPDR